MAYNIALFMCEDCRHIHQAAEGSYYRIESFHCHEFGRRYKLACDLHQFQVSSRDPQARIPHEECLRLGSILHAFDPGAWEVTSIVLSKEKVRFNYVGASGEVAYVDIAGVN